MKRELVNYLRTSYPTSLRQACKVLNLSTSVYQYRFKRKQDDDEYQRLMIDISDNRPSWGFWMMYALIRSTGRLINHKRLHRLYVEARLNMRRKSRKRIPKRVVEPLTQPLQPNMVWSMDFMRDTLLFGQPFRTFNVMDDFNREALNITTAGSITSLRVIRELEQIRSWRGQPECLRVDNGPEFIAHKLRQWCDERKIMLMFIQAGKPSQNGYIERFNRTFREDILDANLFEDITDVQQFAHQWMWMYNNERPHSSLDYLSPRAFLLKYGKLHAPCDLKDNFEHEFPTFQQDINNQFQLFKPLLLDVAQ